MRRQAALADPDAGWQLRKTLQTEPRVMLLGSATSGFAEIDDPEHALYDLFRIIALRPLDEQDCATLWRTVSGGSAQLQRLVARGAVAVDGGTPRRKQYYVVERMYNIYYLLRRGDPGRVVEALLRFMAYFYSAPELSSIAGSMIVDALLTRPRNQTVSAQLAASALVRKAKLLGELQRSAQALLVYDKVVGQSGASTVPKIAEYVAVALLRKGDLLRAPGRYAAAFGCLS